MAPNLLSNSDLFLSNSAEPVQIISKPYQPTHYKIPTTNHRRWQIVWRNVLIFAYLHISAVYGLYYFFSSHSMWQTKLWCYIVVVFGGIGVTMGAHRLWAHKCFKAHFPLRLLLAIAQTMSLQNDIYEWVRDHRVHHKFTDTDADPHNSSRGFFFSHMGWLLVKKHKDVFIKGKTIDMSDVASDPIVMFQRKYYLLLAPLFCFGVPCLVPWYFWNESFMISWYCCVFRYVLQLHGTWSVNSAAHIWGTKPYDKNINATDNRFVASVAFGEGWHNYHHVFPWDYKAAELGDYCYNWTTSVIDFFARIGWAYDLKTVPIEMIQKRIKRTGDGTKKIDGDGGLEDGHCHDDNLWGWDDADMKEDDKKMAEIHHKKG